jgi:hypothetical protein
LEKLEYGGSWFATTWAYLVGIIAVVVLWGSWFQAAPSGSEVPAPTIRVSTHLVLVDVVVTDKQGKFVSGLHPEDFVVEEKGKTQKIAFFTPSGESQSVRGWPPRVRKGVLARSSRLKL